MKLTFEINNLLYMKKNIPQTPYFDRNFDGETKLKISEKLSNLPTIKLADVHDLQGEFKDLSTQNFERLASLIEKHGFKYPLYIWQNPKDLLFYNLDGNQRQRVLETLYGNEIELPYVEVKAKNAKEAKKQILALNSNFGTVTKDGFDFLTADFDADDFLEIKTDFTFENFLDIDIEKIDDYSDKNKEIDTDEFSDKMELKLLFTSDEFQFIQDELSKIDANKENALLKMLGYES